ncbi:uncharacterized protein FYW47_013047 [Aplochiton taeniatus]
MYGNPQSVEDVHKVSKKCSYSKWANREILCDRNYMEVSIHVVPPHIEGKTVEKHDRLQDESWINAIPDAVDAPVGIWKMTFYTPTPKVMLLAEAQRAGYGAMTTPSRLVMRSPYGTPETYSEDVAGVPMDVLKVSTFLKTPYGLNMLDSAAACPTGGVVFSEEVITWHVPRRITPLMNKAVTILEMHMGIDGMRLDKTRMAARKYSLSDTGSHFVIEIPVGSPDGYYKSHALNYQYHITFTIDPMLELLWLADNGETRYKVLYPITTPLMPRFPQVTNRTVPEQRIFTVHLGPFFNDVELINITFSNGVLSVADCNARGFNVQEHRFSNGSKTFSLTVPFSDDVVQKHNPSPHVTIYSLPLVFGLLILPEHTPFPHTAELEVSLQDVVMPTITGSCDLEQFYLTVKYGNQGHNFQTMIGSRDLTPELAALYSLTKNSTHFSLVVPYTAADISFELLQSFSVKGRVDLRLWKFNDNWKLADFSLACNFPLTTTECYANGTMTALAANIESVPNLVLSQLTLRDASCKPMLSDARFAVFSFHVDSCGTTRTFFEDFMIYANEIAMHQTTGKGPYGRKAPQVPEYRQVVSCYYKIDQAETLMFHAKPTLNVPIAEAGKGQLIVQMRLAQDVSYEQFYKAEDYPVGKYLREPLYFEVELMQSDPQIELILENCWANLREERTSLPSWDIIVDSCENLDDRYLTVFYPVVAGSRALIPTHIKRFSMKMFTFTQDDVVLKDQIFVHCDAVLCDTNTPMGVCSGQCANPSTKLSRPQGIKRGSLATVGLAG